MGSLWRNKDEGILGESPVVLARSLWRVSELVSVEALRSPLGAGRGFPGGGHAFLASGARQAGLWSGSRRLQPVLAAGRGGGGGKGRARRSRHRPRPPGRRPPQLRVEIPAPVLIWAAGSGSRACPTSLYPNLVVEVWRFQWPEDSARPSAAGGGAGG